MRKHGVVMKEIGLETIIDRLRPNIEKVSRDLFPELVGETGLDSYKAYTIEYDADDKEYLKDIGTHFDNSEVTLNVSLTDDHDGGELYFIRLVIKSFENKKNLIYVSGMRRCVPLNTEKELGSFMQERSCMEPCQSFQGREPT